MEMIKIIVLLNYLGALPGRSILTSTLLGVIKDLKQVVVFMLKRCSSAYWSTT